MKNFTLVFLIYLISCSNLFGQSFDGQKYFKELLRINQIKHLPISKKELIDSTFIYYQADIDSLKENAVFSNVVLNKFFAKKITNYATSTGDLSFSNFFANVNSTEKTLSIGASFRLDNARSYLFSKKKREYIKLVRPIQKVEDLFTFYFKTDIRNSFSTISSKKNGVYNYNDNIGVGGKYTHVYNGNIIEKNDLLILKVREEIIKKEFKDDLDKFDDDAYKKELKLDKIKEDIDGFINFSHSSKNEKNVLNKKYIELYQAIADKKIKYIEDYNLLNYSDVSWISGEFYIPLTNKDIYSTRDKIAIDTSRVNNWRISADYNYLRSYNKLSYKITLQTSIFSSNNFRAKGNSPLNSLPIIKDNTTNQFQGSSSSVFDGEFDPFPVGRFKAEIVTLFLDNTVGLSVAFEEDFFGDIKNSNWKLGIPFSLKDKEKKPTVNFELQWREVNNTRTIGIALGYNFGRFIN